MHGNMQGTKCEELVFCNERFTITCGFHEAYSYPLGNLVGKEESYPRGYFSEPSFHPSLCHILSS